MKKIDTLLAILLLAAALAGAQTQARVRSFTGKVEILGAQQAWVPVKAGMSLGLGTTISTGFNSTAVLELGSSVLQVKPLTRLRLNELVAREGTVTTDLFLQVGKIRAEVKSAEGLAQDFKVKSPVSTAAVRGTGFEYDGYELYVFEGTVTYSNLTGQSRSYSPGEQGGTDGYDTPSGRRTAAAVRLRGEPLHPRRRERERDRAVGDGPRHGQRRYQRDFPADVVAKGDGHDEENRAWHKHSSGGAGPGLLLLEARF